MGTDVVLLVVVVVVVAVAVAVVVVSQWRRENVIVLGTAGVRGFERRLSGTGQTARNARWKKSGQRWQCRSPMPKFGHRHPQTPYMSLNLTLKQHRTII